MKQLLHRCVALGCAAMLCAAVTAYPMPLSIVGPVLVAYAGLLWWKPEAWLFALPLLLPILDFAPWTGSFFVQEFDLLVLATAMVGHWRTAAWPGYVRLPYFYGIAFALLVLLGGASALSTLSPLQAPSASDLATPLSPWNALRIFKGFAWAALLLPLLPRTAGPSNKNIERLFVPGLLAGLALTCLAVLWERALFPGLLNFTDDYRPTGPFSAMHTGGAALDAYLALAFPFAACWLRDPQRLIRSAAALCIALLAAYAGFASFSRDIYLAYGGAAAVLLFFFARGHRTRRAGSRLRWTAAAGVGTGLFYLLARVFATGGYRGLALAFTVVSVASLAVMARTRQANARNLLAGALLAVLYATAIPTTGSYYFAERARSATGDLAQRVRHWNEVLAMRAPGTSTALFGMGIGSYPLAWYWHNPRGDTPGTFSFESEHRINAYLRMVTARYAQGYGEVVRMLQRIDAVPGQPLHLALDVRRSNARPVLAVAVCQRWLLYPQFCSTALLRLHRPDSLWQHYEADLRAGTAHGRHWWPDPPVQLELSVSGQAGSVDIDNVSLRDPASGTELVRNGSFSYANQGWYFTSDRNHLPWHVKNFFVNLLFELGWAGALLGGALLLFAGCSLAGRAWDGDLFSAICLASLTAVMLVGLFDSLCDVPRITTLLFLVPAIGLARPQAARSPA